MALPMEPEITQLDRVVQDTVGRRRGAVTGAQLGEMGALDLRADVAHQASDMTDPGRRLEVGVGTGVQLASELLPEPVFDERYDPPDPPRRVAPRRRYRAVPLGRGGDRAYL
jgi:hypothetical protein